jgi:hypothetical protein
MTINGSGISDISRVLHISPNTLMKTVKEQAAALPQTNLPDRLADLEIDKMWMFIGKKANEQWLWYSYDARCKEVVKWL